MFSFPLTTAKDRQKDEDGAIEIRGTSDAELMGLSIIWNQFDFASQHLVEYMKEVC